MKNHNVKALKCVLDGPLTLFSNLPLFFRLISGPLAVTIFLDIAIVMLVKNHMTQAVLIGSLIVKAGVFLYFDLLFDISVTRLSASLPLGTHFTRLTFGGAGWQSLWVNSKYFVLSLLYWVLVFGALYGFLGLNNEDSARAIFQYIWDETQLPASILALTETLIFNTMIVFLVALFFFIYLAIRLQFAEPAANLVEDARLKTAWRLTRGHNWFLIRLVLIVLPLWVGSFYLETGCEKLTSQISGQPVSASRFLLKNLVQSSGYVHHTQRDPLDSSVFLDKAFSLSTHQPSSLYNQDAEVAPQENPVFVTAPNTDTPWLLSLIVSGVLNGLMFYAYSFIIGVILARAYLSLKKTQGE